MNLMTTEQSTPAMRSLEGKVSLVTGSTSGIGLGVAHALAAAGSAVILNGFGKPDEIKTEQNKIAEAFGVPVTYSGADMSKPEDIEEMFKLVLGEFGTVDVLVNNAGIQHVEPIESFPVAKWDAILAINLSSAFHTTRLTLPGMAEKGWGRIINVASAHGLIASPFKTAYVAAKHGMVGLTKVKAMEAAEKGITCNAICPGYVYTPLVEKQIGEQAEAHGIPREDVIRNVLLAGQPNKRFATVEELGGIALFLTSEAATSITGTTISADGGWPAH